MLNCDKCVRKLHSPKFWILSEFIHVSYRKYCIFFDLEDIISLFVRTFPNTFYHNINEKHFVFKLQIFLCTFFLKICFFRTKYGWDIDNTASTLKHSIDNRTILCTLRITALRMFVHVIKRIKLFFKYIINIYTYNFIKKST